MKHIYNKNTNTKPSSKKRTQNNKQTNTQAMNKEKLKLRWKMMRRRKEISQRNQETKKTDKQKLTKN